MIKDKITAADIMNYEYCPRIVYFTKVLKLPQTKSAKQKKGLEKDFSFKKDSSRNKILKNNFQNLILKRKYNLSLETEEFATKIDCLFINEQNKEAYPLQLKYGQKPKFGYYRTQKLQLLFEAMLIEKVLGYKVPYGYIKYILSNDLIKISLINKEELFQTIEKVKEIIKNEIYPKATKYKKRIVDNCYRRFY
ncbi:MAG: CRISPR-associated protein Cas4 [Candidatus Pacearchaeota archaeon]|nr:CRISPR-associated protein Cas4 [Candidatus Pacearchaeota archaeon]